MKPRLTILLLVGLGAHAAELIQAIAPIVDGKDGGGKDAGQLDAALAKAKDLFA